MDKIVSLERDLARATSAERINILAPIPGKDTVGIELANTRKVTVKLRELFQSTDWDTAKEHARIPLALGKDVYGKTIIADLAQMPHLLVAGTTGSGKSVCINALIASMLFRFTPEEMRELSYISIHVFDRLAEIRSLDTRFRDTLTDREVDCLNWTAAGQTSVVAAPGVGA